MIIDDLVAATKRRVAREKQLVTYEEIKNQALSMAITDDFTFEAALRKPGVSFICEVKKASPSKGVIASDFDFLKVAREYEQAGADAISVLTEPDYFQGHIDYLKAIHQEVSLPLLRKDFIIDDYMIYQAKVYGASAVLLIASILDDETLSSYLSLTQTLGLSALVEAHNPEEIEKAVKAGARMIGINNRDLRDFSVDIHNSLRYRHLIPEDVVFVSESGIENREQIIELEQNNVQAVLIGETMMRAQDKQSLIKTLRGQL
ncbi:MAG: indole-3-glycerol phosphate synthase TrpC [Erysipelotrichaceae bacterium]|nr:indole-3-glycerol phosphate synthase TrpC [Erysipelotrichaceae bacterium]